VKSGKSDIVSLPAGSTVLIVRDSAILSGMIEIACDHELYNLGRETAAMLRWELPAESKSVANS